MKFNVRTLLITILVFFSINVMHGQKSCSGVLIDFETDEGFVVFGPDNEIWQIGNPDKTHFNGSYNGENAIVTDIHNSYGNSCNSYFQIKSINDRADNLTQFSFCHKYQTDTIGDFGYVTFSLDGGENWSLCQDTSFMYAPSCWNYAEVWHGREYLLPPYFSSNVVGPFFSGSETTWMRETYSFFWWFGVKKGSSSGEDPDPCSADSILFRFHFESDSLDNSKDGWMIDDIRVDWDFSGDIQNKSKTSIEVFPNPCGDFINVVNADFNTIKIVDLTGTVLVSNEVEIKESLVVNTSILKPGVYILRLQTKSGEVFNQLIYKD